ncbi:MAG: HupE/UreJ family protein [Myxococcota bacterium]
MNRRYVGPAICLLIGLAATSAVAHPFRYQNRVDVDGDIKIVGGKFTVDIHIPVGPYLDRQPETEEQRLIQERNRERIIQFFQDGVSVGFTAPGPDKFDGIGVNAVKLVQVPDYDEKSGETGWGWVARFDGDVPKTARRLHIMLSPDANRVMGRVHFVASYGGGGFERLVTKEAFESETSIPTRVSTFEVVRSYVELGFLHIIPRGLDHILFVLGLFLLSPRARPLLWQVSAYTVAHSVTLGLAMAGIWQLPGDIVEPVIAASIVYVAIENLYTSELNPWRPVLVLLFGLLHGLGFAGVLGEIGMPTDGFFTALLSFNVGVELGQLAVIAIAFALVFQIRERPTYRRWVVIPTSAVIALIGFYWTIERVYF